MNIGKHGEWTLIRLIKTYRRPCGTKVKVWRCKCSCGFVKDVDLHSILYGRSRTCGHRRRRYGSENPGWKGGRYKSKDGYIVVQGTKIDGNRFGRGLEHQNVMEKILGRPLRKGETVHHKNGIRDDNRPRNLELWASRHPKGQRVSDLVKWATRLLKTYKPQALK